MSFTPGFPGRFTRVIRSGYLVLLSPEESHHLPGADIASVASLIDGRTDVASIARRLHGAIPARRIREIIEMLRGRGLVVAAAADSSLSYLAEIAGAGPATQPALARASVSIDSDDDSDAEQFVITLQTLGIRVSRSARFTVVIAQDLLSSRLERLNEWLYAKRRPWLLLRPGGHEPSIGPLFIPGQTGCWACLAHRLKENRWLESRMYGPRYTDAAPAPPFRPLGTTPLAVLLLAANQVAMWLLNPRHHALAGRLWRFPAGSPRAGADILTRRPRCPVCGRAAPRRAARERFTNPSIASVTGGGYRAATPEETVARLEHLVSPVTGIVPSLSTFGRRGAFLYGASHTLPLPAAEAVCRIFGQPGAASGKGASEAEAKAGCLAEAVERYSAAFDGTEPLVRARADRLSAAVTPPKLVHFSAAQFAGREAWNRSHGNFQRVPEPFDPCRAVDWSKAKSLLSGRPVFLPAAYCYLQYRDPAVPEYCYANTNGCAAGNVPEEAVLQGLLELIERDAIAVSWYNRVRRPAVDLESFGDPRVSRMASRFLARGRSLAVLDLSNDLEVPVFGAVSASPRGRRILFGFGAHLDARIALTRALAELDQVLTSAPAADAPEKAGRSGSLADYLRWARAASLDNQPYLVPLRARREAKRYPAPPQGGLLDCLETLFDRCRRLGLDVLALDLTRDDIAFPVFRIAVPGLRHCWAQFGPGRLYDVPVALGWLTRPRSESELNPFPFFL